jgi:hypothetical protein
MNFDTATGGDDRVDCCGLAGESEALAGGISIQAVPLDERGTDAEHGRRFPDRQPRRAARPRRRPERPAAGPRASQVRLA